MMTMVAIIWATMEVPLMVMVGHRGPHSTVAEQKKSVSQEKYLQSDVKFAKIGLLVSREKSVRIRHSQG